MLPKFISSPVQSAHGNASHEPHVLPLKVYFGIFGSLLVLTVVTVLVSHLGLPPTLSIIVALSVALVKASLVAGYFMHLKYEDRFYSFILIASLFFIGLFFFFLLTDLSFRGAVIPEQSDFLLEKYEPSK
jgi:cytochrome c oxidase subunit 4